MKQIDDKDYDLVEDYIRRRMPEADKKDFEERLRKEKDLQTIFKVNLAVNRAIQEANYKKLVTQISSGYKKRQLKKQLYKGFSVSAILAFMLSISYLLLTNDISNNKLFSEYYNAYPVNTTIRGVNSSIQSVKSLYENNDYNACINLYNSLSTSQKNDSENMFFAGLSLLEQDNSNAETYLNNVAISRSSYSTSAKWYLSLLHIKHENTDEARKLLNDLLSTNNFYTEKAKSLLKQLD